MGETIKVLFDTFIMHIVVGLFFVNVVETQLGRKFSKCTDMDCYFSYSENRRLFVCGIVCPLDWGSRGRLCSYYYGEKSFSLLLTYGRRALGRLRVSLLVRRE